MSLAAVYSVVIEGARHIIIPIDYPIGLYQSEGQSGAQCLAVLLRELQITSGGTSLFAAAAVAAAVALGRSLRCKKLYRLQLKIVAGHAPPSLPSLPLLPIHLSCISAVVQPPYFIHYLDSNTAGTSTLTPHTLAPD